MSESEIPKFQRPKRSTPMAIGESDQNPKDIGYWALLAEDLRTHEGNISSPGFLVIALHRFGNWRMGIKPKILRAPFSLLYKILYGPLALILGIELPYNTRLGRRVRIWHYGGIFIGAHSIGDDVHLRHNTTIGVLHRGEDDAKPSIGDRVDIGCGAVIAGSIVVGDDVMIGANTVVVKDIPDGATILGVPGRPVRIMKANEGSQEKA